MNRRTRWTCLAALLVLFAVGATLGDEASRQCIGGVCVHDGAVVCMGGGTIVIDGRTLSCPGNNKLIDNVSPKHCNGGLWSGFPCTINADCPPTPQFACVDGLIPADMVDRRMGGATLQPIAAENNQWGNPGVADPRPLIHGQGVNEASIDWDPVCLAAPCGGSPPLEPGLRLSGVTLSNVTVTSVGE